MPSRSALLMLDDIRSIEFLGEGVLRMARKLLVEGYKPSGKEVTAARGYQPGTGASERPIGAPKPPRATSANVKPASGK